MGKPNGVTHSTEWPDLEMSLALSVSQSCNEGMPAAVKTGRIVIRKSHQLRANTLAVEQVRGKTAVASSVFTDCQE